MQLLVAHPTQFRTVVHGVDKKVANVPRRANGDEQPVHSIPFPQMNETRHCPVSLERPPRIYDIFACDGPVARAKEMKCRTSLTRARVRPASARPCPSAFRAPHGM